MKERRRYMRFKTTLKVAYRVLSGLPVEVTALATDVNREGICLSDESSMQQNAVVELMIKIPEYDAPIVAFAENVWSKKINSSNVSKGMRFTKIKPADRARLIDFAYHRLAQT